MPYYDLLDALSDGIEIEYEVLPPEQRLAWAGTGVRIAAAGTAASNHRLRAECASRFLGMNHGIGA